MKITRSVGEKRRLDCEGNCELARINYVVSDVKMAETDRALLEVFAMAPASWQNIPKDSVEILSSPGGGMLEIGVTYRGESSGKTYTFSSGRKKNGSREWWLDVSTKSGNRKYSAGKCIFSRSLKPGVPAVDPGDKINWNGKFGSASETGEVVVYKPEAVLHCLATMKKSMVEKTSYIRAALALIGKVNSESFHNWNAGELLFSGMKRSGSVRGSDGEDLCNIDFSFRVSCCGEQTLGGVTVPVDGWDYFWAMRRDIPGKEEISSVHISRVYDRGSFAVLNI